MGTPTLTRTLRLVTLYGWGIPNSNWVLTNINKDYEVSNTVSEWGVPNSKWVLTNINKDSEVSNTGYGWGIPNSKWALTNINKDLRCICFCLLPDPVLNHIETNRFCLVVWCLHVL